MDKTQNLFIFGGNCISGLHHVLKLATVPARFSLKVLKDYEDEGEFAQFLEYLKTNTRGHKCDISLDCYPDLWDSCDKALLTLAQAGLVFGKIWVCFF